jgi:hypothetical protein
MGLALAGCGGPAKRVKLASSTSSEVEEALGDYFSVIDKAIETGEGDGAPGIPTDHEDPIVKAVADALRIGQALNGSGNSVVRTERKLPKIPSTVSLSGDRITFRIESTTTRYMATGPEWGEVMPHLVTYSTATHRLVSVVDMDPAWLARQ